MKKVLVIGRHESMLGSVLQLLRSNQYEAMGTTTNDDAEKIFTAWQPDFVVIGGGVDEASRSFFHQTFRSVDKAVRVIDAHPGTVLAQLRE